MKKCICDRCAKEFKPADRGVGTIMLKANAPNHRCWPYGLEFDLCYTCLQDLEKFMERK